MAGNVADINVMKALGVGDRLGPFQGFHGRVGQILQQVVGMEPREVHRNVGAQFRFDPPRQAFELLLGIVQGWNHQVYDFVPDVLLADRGQRVLNRLQLAVDHLFIELLREPF
jgi:hypothetical protein